MGQRRGFNLKSVTRLAELLDVLNAATTIQDLKFPGSGLKPLEGNRWAIKVLDNRAITFRFDGKVYDIDYEDYD